MNVTIINDCRDANARGRQAARVASLFGSTPNFIGVSNDIEASGNLIDVLDAVGGDQHIVLVNVAPRQGRQEKFSNGTPFGYFSYRNTVVVTTVDGMTLSLAKKLGVLKSLKVIDLEKSVDVLMQERLIVTEDLQKTVSTQFRSFDFVPYAALMLSKGKKLPSESIAVIDIPDCPAVVWWVDSFGNCKTTLFRHELEVTKDMVQSIFGSLPYITHLRDVPDDTLAFIEGSSGLGDKRFVELVVQGKSAAQKCSLTSGDYIVRG